MSRWRETPADVHIDETAIALLADYSWPRNIRELEQLAMNLHDSDSLTIESLRALAHRWLANGAPGWPLVPYLLERL
jgi:transcriptional regulator with PAS, ATPase and Fis domain